ncbi:unnamed protein product [Schistosoma curassoni]|uniref:UDP-glucose 4-epimerase n=1 Tax=Schistosoma curassoni TaxID=6186 RepID=A0A183JWL1_9TREM|nr:unnamed protein product [Schistosoma curassoni]
MSLNWTNVTEVQGLNSEGLEAHNVGNTLKHFEYLVFEDLLRFFRQNVHKHQIPVDS